MPRRLSRGYIGTIYRCIKMTMCHFFYKKMMYKDRSGACLPSA